MRCPRPLVPPPPRPRFDSRQITAPGSDPAALRTASRRQWLRAGAGTALLALATAWARGLEPIERRGTARLLPGLAAFSFRQHFPVSRGREQEARDPVMTMQGFVDYCAEQQVAAEVTAYFFERHDEPSTYTGLRRHAFLRGVTLSGTAIGNDFTVAAADDLAAEIADAKRWIDRAVLLGAPQVRVFAGRGADMEWERAIDRAAGALRECADYAGERGIMLGLENHGGIVAEADQLLELLGRVDSPWLGICLDSGNFRTVDPYADLEKCAPWAINVQLKVMIHPQGQDDEETDFERVMAMLRAVNYQGYVVLEYEEPEDPYVAVPRHLERLRPLMADG